MNILDIIILICCIPILISGYKKGFINQAISIIALFAGVQLALSFGDNVGTWFLPIMEGNCDAPQAMASLAGFATVLVLACVVIGLTGTLIEKIILIVIPDIINKVLGVILAAVNGVLLFCTFYTIFNILNEIYQFTDMKQAIFSDSVLLPIIESTSSTIFPDFLSIFNI